MVDLQRADYQLADRYRSTDGVVFLSGVQALARMPLDRLRADHQAGLRTAAFVTGYQGSPLAGLGEAMMAAARTEPELPIVVRPAVNEELAATAVMGSQLAATLDDCRYDGVVGLWYGKAPGLDRASDALRHAVFAGTARAGGAVAIVGDDPAAKSSTLPSSSDAALVDLHMPILYPGDVQEVIDLGRHAIELSRASGLWTSLKVVANVADGTGTVEVHPERHRALMPEIRVDGHGFVPHPSGRLLTPFTLELEREFRDVRLEVARQYGVDNHLNTVPVHTHDDWIGLVASGHTYQELREALALAGLPDDESLRRAGIRLLQLRLPVPLDPRLVRGFARGLREVMVVEEKNPTLEWLVKDALYEQDERPIVTGKRDPDGRPLVPATGALDADALWGPVHRRLAQRLEDLAAPPPPERPRIALTHNRTPYFCSGCPHNTSTRVPEGTLVGGGIGCHAMVALMEPERVGDIAGLTAMGNEGAQWIGMAPFVDRQHFVQNLGDGTYFHSGTLAVRAAVAAGVDITYKLLYNGTVAMTGGQHAEGAVPVAQVAAELLLEGVSRVVITTDDVERYRRAELPAGVAVRPREELIDVQVELARVPGVTVLIHDQECAAERRREQHRGRRAVPTTRVLIDERVCEGCGDCGAKSNCLSVQPVDTPFGRKTRIHQTSCNLDRSCLQGDCPSFATVRPARRRTPVAAPVVEVHPVPVAPVADLPAPAPVVPTDACTIRLSGIGGTGVVTVSQVLGTAALLDGWAVRGLDQTGLSQKAGPVVSDVRLRRGRPPHSNKASAGSADCHVAFDLLVAAGETPIAAGRRDRTVVIGSTSSTPTGAMVTHPERAAPELDVLRARLDGAGRPDDSRYVDAAALAHGLFGDTTTTNIVLLGVAVQAGAVPVDPAAIEQAIELNGVAVDRNVQAFRWGRRWVLDPAGVEAAAGLAEQAPLGWEHEPYESLVARLAADLVDYQSPAYARRYRDAVERIAAAEDRVAPGSTRLAAAAARQLHHLMAAKDEYEVARLLLRPEAREAAEAVAGPGARITWHLHPPLLREHGLQHKLRLGPWARPALAALRATRRVRGTALDPFGRAEVRRLERSLVEEYLDVLDRLAAVLTADNLDQAVVIAELADQVRGYEGLKVERAAAYRAELAVRLAALTT